LLKFKSADLGVVPITGPFSKYMTPHETAILVTLVKSVAPKVMIEFGCNAGITAARLLENVPTLQHYIGIDVPSDHVTTLRCQRSEVPLNAGAHAADDARFHLLTVPSQTISADDLEPCDAVFIDGDHSEAAVLHESRLARELVRPGGIICWHDFFNPDVEVTRALTSLQGEGWAINCVEDSWLAFLRA
jgi:predicted O-methyltransferase YrrM